MSGNNMYPWVTKQRNFCGGECPHRCVYCYVNTLKKKFPAVRQRYSGPLGLIEKELEKSEGKGRMIFVQDCSDLFAKAMPCEWIERVLQHCRQYPGNTYLFQTKNPIRFFDFVRQFPEKSFLGTTIESDINYPGISKAPSVTLRAEAMAGLNGFDKMVSIEPVMDFDLELFVDMIRKINPLFVSIGADSKRHGLKEPSAEKLHGLINALREFTEVRIKDNLYRILKDDCRTSIRPVYYTE